MLSEISPSDKDNYHMVSLTMWNIRKTAQDHSGREGNWTGTYQRRRKTKRGSN